MKKLLTATLVSFICAAFYLFVFAGINSDFSYNSFNSKAGNASKIISQTQSKNFVNCIFNDAYESWNHQAWILKFLDRYKDSLHFNTLHYYNYPESSNYYGSFNFPMSDTQIIHNVDLLDSVEAKDLVTFTARQNIEKYCYGQRLIYEVSSGGSTTLNDGFCYQNVMSNTYTTDSGRTVLHARPWQGDNYNTAGYLCKTIYENLQHTDIYDFVQLDAQDWHIKPMMRIDSSIFSITNTTPVVAIVAVNYSGTPIDSIVVRVNNFKNDSNEYEGIYQNIFKFEQGIDSLKTSGSPSTGLGAGRDDDFRLWVNNCKVDFRVYWFGQVEVWFDKMTVDDDRARRLFDPAITELPIDSLIRQESRELGSHSANFSFYVDEVVYSNYPCVNYIDSILKSEIRIQNFIQQ